MDNPRNLALTINVYSIFLATVMVIQFSASPEIYLKIDVYTNPQTYQMGFPVLLNQRHVAHLFLIKNASKLSDQTYNGNLCSDSPQLLAVATDAMISPHQVLQVCKTFSASSLQDLFRKIPKRKALTALRGPRHMIY